MSSPSYLVIRFDLQVDVVRQVKVGAALYQQRTGHWPDKILLNPWIIANHQVAELGTILESSKNVLRNVAYLGTDYTSEGVKE
jgi:hypothetical protein